jgi:hypothetical protein
LEDIRLAGGREPELRLPLGGSTLARVILVLGASPNARRAGVGSRPVGALAATSNV